MVAAIPAPSLPARENIITPVPDTYLLHLLQKQPVLPEHKAKRFALYYIIIRTGKSQCCFCTLNAIFPKLFTLPRFDAAAAVFLMRTVRITRRVLSYRTNFPICQRKEPEISFRLLSASGVISVSHSPFTRIIILHGVLPKRYFQKKKPQNIDLFFFKRSTCSFSAIICPTAFNIHVVRIALIICIINAFIRLAVNTNGSAGMRYGACKCSHVASVLKTSAAGIILSAGMSAFYHDIPFAAAPVAIIGTVFHRTT